MQTSIRYFYFGGTNLSELIFYASTDSPLSLSPQPAPGTALRDEYHTPLPDIFTGHRMQSVLGRRPRAAAGPPRHPSVSTPHRRAMKMSGAPWHVLECRHSRCALLPITRLLCLGGPWEGSWALPHGGYADGSRQCRAWHLTLGPRM